MKSATLTVKEYERLPEHERQEIDCKFCGKELIGRLFCNPICRERYNRWVCK